MLEWTKKRQAAAGAIGLTVCALAFGLGRCTAADGTGQRADESATPATSQEAADWTCSMHPQVHRAEPGACPICGMDLILASQAAAERGPGQVVLSPRARELARIRTVEVDQGEAGSGTLRLLGRVDTDETSERSVTAWTAGRIERLVVRFTGQRIVKGQAVAQLYSPEIYAAHQDLIQAARQVSALAQGTPTAKLAAQAGLEAAESRLTLLGVTRAELARMRKAKSPWQQVPVRSPFAGTVVRRLATEGAYVKTGDSLYEVVDLSRLWVQLDAYESDLEALKRGQEVSLRFDALAGEELKGCIAFFDPVVSAERRTARVRVEVRDPESRLRPGMFAEAVVQTGDTELRAERLFVPATAPLFTGRRSIVFVEGHTDERTGTRYQAREVHLGGRMGERYPVLAGLSPGDRVVVEGAFALDADLQIRGGASMMTRRDDRQRPPPLGVQDSAVFAEVLRLYLALVEALASDDLAVAQGRAQELAALVPALPVPVRGGLGDSVERLQELASAATLVAMRASLAGLSPAVARLTADFGNPLAEPLSLAYCPMALGEDGATWLQARGAVRNPYMGPAMLGCGVERDAWSAAGAAPTALSTAKKSAAPRKAGGGKAAGAATKPSPEKKNAGKAGSPPSGTPDPHAHHRHPGGSGK